VSAGISSRDRVLATVILVLGEMGRRLQPPSFGEHPGFSVKTK